MKHNVELSRRAQNDIEATYLRIREDAPGRAMRWRQRLLDEIDSLERFPLRHALAPEAEAVGIEMRQMYLASSASSMWSKGSRVDVLTVRHGARRFIGPQDFEGVE